ncbi:hypothetical protein OS493_002682 [Desmophyllum pertusum]|uniref:Uncharacterized protein n=1 Tax=Desmophyllum pertusum TaxID=174260 RepID=A0A9W9YTC0_9CNID|nr:hypothetical protein OS493_002682 [Desmophyllum pertusum]
MAVRLNSRRLASLEKVGSATLISLALCFSVGLVLADSVKVACFIGADQLTELRDFTREVNWDNTNKVVKRCAALAKTKDYKLFALGKSGVCLSGPDMKKKYHVKGSSKCNHGIGIGNNMFVYSLAPRPSLKAIGCYHDKSNDRALPVEYANFRGKKIDWGRMELTVYKCAQVAYDKGYEYFAVQFYGVCYSGEDAGETEYAKHGESVKSDDCWEFDKHSGFGVGKDLTNFVYRIKQVG